MMTQDPIYASQARPWLKYYDQKYIEQTIPTVSAFEYVCQRNKNHLNDTALDYYGRKFTMLTSSSTSRRLPPPCGASASRRATS